MRPSTAKIPDKTKDSVLIWRERIRFGAGNKSRQNAAPGSRIQSRVLVLLAKNAGRDRLNSMVIHARQSPNPMRFQSKSAKDGMVQLSEACGAVRFDCARAFMNGVLILWELVKR